ncbi:MAG: toprim domain-containing protein, partial [Candidatus Helarchaeota archaeon]
IYDAYADAYTIVMEWAMQFDATLDIPEAAVRLANEIWNRIESRGWKKETAIKMGIGGIHSFREYKDRMLSRGWDKRFLEKYGLLNTQIFNKNGIIFTLFDKNNRVCGFASRNLDYDKYKTKEEAKAAGIRKYTNSPSTPIFKKSEFLYNYNNLPNELEGIKHIYIVEGYPDVLTLIDNNILNVVGLCGTAFGKEHLELLEARKIHSVTFALDFDSAGISATFNAIMKYFTNSDIKIDILYLKDLKNPSKNIDVDDFVRKYGIQEFKKLARLTPYEWRKIVQPELPNKWDRLNDLLPYIAIESKLMQQKAIEQLADEFQVSKHILNQALEEYLDAQKLDIKNKSRQLILRTLHYINDRSDVDPIRALDHLQLKLEELKTSTTVVTEDNYINAIRNYKKSVEIPSFKLTLNKGLDRLLYGIPKAPMLMTLGGLPHIGKCLHKDTIIKTTEGLKRISELKIGDEILTLENQSNPVYTKVKNIEKQTSDDIYLLVLKNGTYLYATGKHKFPVFDNKGVYRGKLSINRIRKMKGDYYVLYYRNNKNIFDIKDGLYFTKEDRLHIMYGYILGFGVKMENKFGFQHERKDILDDISNLIELYKSITKQNKPFTDFFKQYHLENVQIQHRYIPMEYWNKITPVQRFLFLKGLLNSLLDLDKIKNLTFVHASIQLLVDLQVILNFEYGVRTKISQMKSYYYLEPYKNDDALKLVSIFNLTHPNRNLLPDHPITVENVPITELIKITRVIKYEKIEDVYNIEVAHHGHNFIANGILTSNSSFCRYLAYDLVISNDDVLVLYFTIDDPFRRTFSGFISIDTKIPYAYIEHPRKFADYHPEIFLNKTTLDTWNKTIDLSIKKFEKLSKKLLIFDSVSGGNTLTAIERIIKRFQTKIEKHDLHKYIVLFIDNFHNITTETKVESEVARQIKLIQGLVNLSHKYNLPTIMTVELRKTKDETKRPTLQDISGTIKIEYLGDVIALMHQEYFYKKDTILTWENPYGIIHKLPINEFNVLKNKVSGGKGLLYLKFDETISTFYDLTDDERLQLEHKLRNQRIEKILNKSDKSNEKLAQLNFEF